MGEFDIFIFGNISIDIIKTPSEEYSATGGAVLYAVWVAHQLGYKVQVLTKVRKKDRDRLQSFPRDNIELHWVDTEETTSIKNDYTTATMETRICTNLGAADPYKIEDFPEIKADLIQYSGLIVGEINAEIISYLSKKGKLAVDVQGMTRKVYPDGRMEFSKWEDMDESLPHITYLKADAAEAHFLTGYDTSEREGRIKAARFFLDKGVKEVIISHNKELTAISEEGVFTVPFRNRSLKGRTGRGDTCFTAYILERKHDPIERALLFSAALTSLKMEIPGPFKGTRRDVLEFIKEFYPEYEYR